MERKGGKIIIRKKGMQSLVLFANSSSSFFLFLFFFGQTDKRSHYDLINYYITNTLFLIEFNLI